MQAQEGVEHSFQAFFPFGVLPAFLLFIVQVIERGIYAFRLAADAVDRLYEVAFVMHYLVEESCLRETMLQIRVKDSVGICHQVGALFAFAIFQRVESIQQGASHKANFGHVDVVASFRVQLYT